MKKTAKRPLKPVSAMDLLLKSTRQPQASVTALTEQYSSVMGLASADIAQLMQQNPQMHITDARELHERARAMSVVIARQFREQRLTASVRQANRPPTGIKGLVDGPTYTDMFNPDWANHCPPDAIEATTSPVAYLTDLYRYAKELEAKGDPDEVITLDARRPDLKDLVLDHTALNRVEPTLVLVNEILEKSIRTHLDDLGLDEKTVDDALLEARYPNALPFERYTSQINHVLGRKGYSLGDVIRLADPDYPYFKEPGVHSTLSDIALIQDTGFGPVQQALLLEAPYFPDREDEKAINRSLIAGKWRLNPRTRLLTVADVDDEEPSTFFEENFGVGSVLELEDTQTFCLRTGLTTEELEMLLSVGAFAPAASPNVEGLSAQAVDGSCAGSVYINAGVSPGMAIETIPGDDETGQPPVHRIINATPDRFDRMNRMIRLARWLGLPFHDVDQIIVSCMRAERQKQFPIITQNTLRAIGLFQVLRRDYKVTGEDFAAIIQGIGLYGRGKEPSQFDRAFNDQSLFSRPLILDDTPLAINSDNDLERTRVDHLCASLGMTNETFKYLFSLLDRARGELPLTWSVNTVTAFYRLTRLPAYLGVGAIDAVAVLSLLGDSSAGLISGLAAGTKVGLAQHASSSDTLRAVHAWVECLVWMKKTGWKMNQLYFLLGTSFTELAATDSERDLLDQINQRLQAAMITDNSFAELNMPEGASDRVNGQKEEAPDALQALDWFEELSSFIDTGEESNGLTRGLVVYLGDGNEEEYERYLIARVEKALIDSGITDETYGVKISSMVMKARGAQQALLMEALSAYLQVSADQADALLMWAGGDRYFLLKEVRRVAGGGALTQLSIGDEVLQLLMQLAQRAELTRHLGLGGGAIRLFLNHSEWFGVRNTALSFPIIYWLTQYAFLVRFCGKPEEELLNYLNLINLAFAGAEAEAEGDKVLIRDSAAQRLSSYLSWGIREVLTVATYLDEASHAIRSLVEIFFCSRLASLARAAGLDAKALLMLGTLQPTSDALAYNEAAKRALASLNDNKLAVDSSDAEVGQSSSHSMTVSVDSLIANKLDEKAVIAINLRDRMDAPYADVTVRWSTNLGRLSSGVTITDANGFSSVELIAGDKTGEANVQAYFGLTETLKAPTVVIGCEPESLTMIATQPDPDSGLANRLEPIEFTVLLKDGYENVGAYQPVMWATTRGEFQRHVSLSDGEGRATAVLRSLSPGSAGVVAYCENGASYTFSEVTFLNEPYFQYVRMADSVNMGYQTQVECRTVEIDGTPRAGCLVKWSTTNGDFASATSETDEDGLAVASLSPSESGNVIVTVSSDDIQKEKSTPKVPVYGVTTLALTAADTLYIENTAPLEFLATLEVEEEPAVNRWVDWSVDGVFKIKTASDSRGVAAFSAVFELGNHTIEAALVGTEVKGSVSIQAVAYRFEVELIGHFAEGAPGLLSRYETYQLKVKVFLADEPTPMPGVPFTLKAQGADVLGMTVDGLGLHESTPEGNVATVSFSDTDLTGVIVLEVEAGGVVKWNRTYKVGYYYKLGGLNDLPFRTFAWLVPDASKDVSHIEGLLHSVFSVELSIPSIQYEKTAIFNSSTMTANLSGFPRVSNGTIVVASPMLTQDGFICVTGGSAEVYNP